MGGAETGSDQDPHSLCDSLQVGGKSQQWSFSQKSKESEPCITIPSLQVLHSEDKPRTCLALKTSRAYVQETQGAIKNWDWALKGRVWSSLTLSPSTEAAAWKAPGSDLLAHPGEPAGGQETAGTPFRDWDAGSSRFATLVYVLALALAGTTWGSSSGLLVPGACPAP